MKSNIKRLGLLICIVMVALILGRSPSPESAMEASRKVDYWVFVALLVGLGWSAWNNERSLRFSSLFRGRTACMLGLAIIASWLLFEIHERNEYKILMDEPLQVGASLMMHAHREAAVPERRHHLNGEAAILESFVDKRPQLFPFVVSIAHDLSGFRLNNAFFVNSALGLVFLILLACGAYRLGAATGAGFGLLLWAGNPEFGRAMNGAGFETLNLLLIAALLLAGWNHLQRRSTASQDLLCLLAVTLAYARYESVIFVLFAGLAVVVAWRQKRTIFLSWGLCAAPLLLIPYLWRQGTFAADASLWQLWDRPGTVQPFSIKYIPENIGHSLNYFLHVGDAYANSFWLAVVGFLGILLSCIVGIRLLRGQLKATFIDTGFWLFLGVFALHFLVMMAYFFGQFDDFIVSRLSLPYYIVLVLCPVYAFSRFPVPRLAKIALFTAAALAFLGYSLPKASQHAYSKSYAPAKELHFAQNFLKKHAPHTTPLIISRMPMLWITLGCDATSIYLVNSHLAPLATYLHEGARPVFLYEIEEFSPSTGTWEIFHKISPGEGSLQLDAQVERKVVKEKLITPYRKLRMSRVTGVSGVEPKVFQGETLSDYLEFRAFNLP